jgi:hypothetical protein
VYVDPIKKKQNKNNKTKVRGGGGSSSPPFISHARFYMPPNHPSLFLRFEPRLREPPILPPAMPLFENVITTTTGKIKKKRTKTILKKETKESSQSWRTSWTNLCTHRTF